MKNSGYGDLSKSRSGHGDLSKNMSGHGDLSKNKSGHGDLSKNMSGHGDLSKNMSGQGDRSKSMSRHGDVSDVGLHIGSWRCLQDEWKFLLRAVDDEVLSVARENGEGQSISLRVRRLSHTHKPTRHRHAVLSTLKSVGVRSSRTCVSTSNKRTCASCYVC